jgi:hypothetical protein
MRRTLTDMGLDIPAGAELTPKALGQFQKWWPVIQAAGIRAE